MSNNVSPEQIRGARGMLGWSMQDLARAAGVSISTVKRIETNSMGSFSASTSVLVSASLESAGVIFLDDEGIGAGVRLKSLGERRGAPLP